MAALPWIFSAGAAEAAQRGAVSIVDDESAADDEALVSAVDEAEEPIDTAKPKKSRKVRRHSAGTSKHPRAKASAKPAGKPKASTKGSPKKSDAKKSDAKKSDAKTSDAKTSDAKKSDAKKTAQKATSGKGAGKLAQSGKAGRDRSKGSTTKSAREQPTSSGALAKSPKKVEKDRSVALSKAAPSKSAPKGKASAPKRAKTEAKPERARKPLPRREKQLERYDDTGE